MRVAGKPVVFVGRHSAIFGEPKAPALLEQYTDLYVAAATAFCGGGQPRFIWDLGIIYVTSGASEGTVTDLVNRVPEGSIAIYATVGRITRRGASELRRFLELATQRRILVGVAHLGPPALRLRGINTDTKRVQTIFWLNWEQVPGLVTCAEEELMVRFVVFAGRPPQKREETRQGARSRPALAVLPPKHNNNNQTSSSAAPPS